MKKTIAGVLTSSALLSSSIFDNNAHNVAQAVYKCISSVQAIIFSMGSDICTASKMSILEKNQLSKNGIDHFIASKKYDMNLTEKELTEGTAHVISYDLGYDWDALTEDEKNACRENVDLFGYLFKDKLSHACVSAILTSYKLNGKIEQANEALRAAKSSINRLCEKFPNYEHSAALKKYYEKTAAYFSFLNLPFDDLSCTLRLIQMYHAELGKVKLPLSTIFDD